jgi:hypothetical protein
MYNLPANYVHRTAPEYFDDVLPDSSAWQADVYRLAVSLARSAGVDWLIDIGCGRGEKLLKYAEDFQTFGFDYGENIKHCPITDQHKWECVDLNTQALRWEYFENSVAVCADVIEHLPHLEALLETLHNACESAAFVLLSTPDRARVYNGREQSGPPGNPYHCREWKLYELIGLLQSKDLPVRWAGWTISNDTRPDQVWTSLIVMSKTHHIQIQNPRYEAATKWNVTP